MLNSAFYNLASPYPTNATPITAASGNVANANAIATLPSASGKFTYIQGCMITAGGVTTGLLVNGTIVGVITGTLTFNYAAVAGVLLGSPALLMNFGSGIQSSALATAIVVTLPALGLGNTNAAVFAWGYQM